MSANEEEEKSKYKECFASVVDAMEDEEKGLLKCVLRYGGKKFQTEAADIVNSSGELKKFGEGITGDWIAEQFEEIFTEGAGIVDVFKGTHYNYGKQLDVTINKVLIKSLKVAKPYFSKAADTYEGAVQREEWITENLMDSLITSMDEEQKRELVRQVEEMLKEKGIDAVKATQAGTALLTGGLTAAKSIMKFQFHKLVAIIANLIVRLLTGHGLSLAANVLLQRIFGFLFGPVGWVITAVTALPLITALANPRGYDKYIPAVFIIGASRISQNGDKENSFEADEKK